MSNPTPPGHRRPPARHERLVGIALVGVLLFNFPLLALFSSDAMPFGLPLLFVYLFIGWGALIFAVGWILERHPRRDRGGGP